MRRLSFIFFVAVVLGGVAVYVANQARPTARNLNPLAKIPQDQIMKVVITKPPMALTLEKPAKNWMLTAPLNDQADNAAVESILGVLSKFNVSAVVSENKASYERYFVDDKQATRLQVYGEAPAPLFDAYFGKQGVSYNETYIRFEGKTPVYVANNLPFYFLQAPPENYRLKRFFVDDPFVALNFRVTAGKTSYSISRSSHDWKNDTTQTLIDSKWVDGLLQKVASLEAISFGTGEEKPETLGFDKPTLTFSWSFDVISHGFIVGKEAKAAATASSVPGTYARVNGRETILIVNKVYIDQFLDYLKTPPPPKA